LITPKSFLDDASFVAYHVFMIRRHQEDAMQYTIRGIPSTVDAELRERARRTRKSLNETVVETLRRGLEMEAAEAIFDDMDDLIGTWQNDSAFDAAVAEQDTVDAAAWQ
jgi:hypothetical protein